MTGIILAVVSAVIAAGAWLYQRAWERHERRLSQYVEFMDLLPAFQQRTQNSAGIEKALAIHRKLWIVAPDDVVRKFDAFLTSIADGSPEPTLDIALQNFVMAMRKDSSFSSALLPRWNTSLQPNEFLLRSPGKPEGGGSPSTSNKAES